MGDKSSPAATGTFVFDLREIISEVRREAEVRKAESLDPLGDTVPPAETTWTQRLSNWFRRG